MNIYHDREESQPQNARRPPGFSSAFSANSAVLAVKELVAAGGRAMRVNLQKAAVALLVVTSLYPTIRQWRSTIGLQRGAKALSAFEARLEGVKETLPIERGIIGYVGEWDVPGTEYSEMDQEAEFLLTQYTLAPLILVKGPEAEWNVAILSGPAFRLWEQSNRGKFEVIHINGNVYLFHRIGEQ